eukprot:TRINITY_DN6688_c0_g1_i3.p1 TRINITY_DN6688_c0_g1~~TRINITY_DN6688_c0_g1_i3.p1  ORF type:complete len:747 (+),score=106.39 TRINITY_DN6688_c0_g1_i3:45-2285(+)
MVRLRWRRVLPAGIAVVLVLQALAVGVEYFRSAPPAPGTQITFARQSPAPTPAPSVASGSEDDDDDGCAIPLTAAHWTGSGGVRFADGAAFLQRGARIKSKRALRRPVAVEADMRATEAGCVAMTVFAEDSGKNSPLSIETGAWRTRMRVFPGDRRAEVGANDRWHSVRINASTGDAVNFWHNSSMVHEGRDAAGSGPVRFVAHCVDVEVRRVRLVGAGGCAESVSLDADSASGVQIDDDPTDAPSQEPVTEEAAHDARHDERSADAPSAAEILAHSARRIPCGKDCKGMALMTLVDAPWSGALHAWLLHAAAAGIPVGQPGGGIVVAAVDEPLMQWCGRHGVPCFRANECSELRARLMSAAKRGALPVPRARLLGPSWCKPLSARAVLRLGYAPLLVDVDVVMVRDPLPYASSLLAAQPHGLWYQCGEREPKIDPRFYGAYDVWPNTGHWLAAPGHEGDALVGLLCEEGEWQTRKVGSLAGQVVRDTTVTGHLTTTGGPRLERPHLPCRERFLGHVVTSWFRYFTKTASAAKLQDPSKERARAHRYAEELISAFRRDNLTLAALNATLVGFCRRLRPAACYAASDNGTEAGFTPTVAIKTLLGDLPMTDAGVVRWMQNLCVDLNWSDQETMREFVQPEVLPQLIKAGKVGPEAQHKCLPVDLFPVVYRQIPVAVGKNKGKKGPKRLKMVADQAHLNSSLPRAPRGRNAHADAYGPLDRRRWRDGEVLRRAYKVSNRIPGRHPEQT